MLAFDKRLHYPTRAVITAQLIFIILSTNWLAQAQAAELAGTWSLWAKSSSIVDLRFAHHDEGSTWEWWSPQQLSDLHGLTAQQLGAPKAIVQFTLARGAGSFVCQGTLTRGDGSGAFTFVPDPGFAKALSERGMAARSVDEQLRLAMSGVTIQFIDALRQAHYNPSVANVLLLVDHDVDATYVEAVARSGGAPETVDGLARLRDHDVTPALLSAMRSAGMRTTAEDAVRLADHDVSPSYLQGLRQLGYSAGADQIVRLVDHDVTLGWIRQVQAQGLRPSVDELIRMRDAGV